jgi:hypothetical protein
MSTRERWIVYPLLFLALGAALRDKVIAKIEIPRLKCGQLEVDGPARCELVECRQSVCGGLAVIGPDGQPAVVAGVNPQAGNSGFIETRSANNLPLVLLKAARLGNFVGGQVVVLSEGGRSIAVLAPPMPPPGGSTAPPRGHAPGPDVSHPRPDKSTPSGSPSNGGKHDAAKPNPSASPRVK